MNKTSKIVKNIVSTRFSKALIFLRYEGLQNFDGPLQKHSTVFSKREHVEL